MSNASSSTKNDAVPFKFGKTGPEQRMILNAKGDYVCTVQIYQTPRNFGIYDEARREFGAELILRSLNSHDQLVAALREANTHLDAARLPGYTETSAEGGGVYEDEGGSFVSRHHVQELMVEYLRIVNAALAAAEAA